MEGSDPRKLKTTEDHVSARGAGGESDSNGRSTDTKAWWVKEICGPLRLGMRVVVGWGLTVSQ